MVGKYIDNFNGYDCSPFNHLIYIIHKIHFNALLFKKIILKNYEPTNFMIKNLLSWKWKTKTFEENLN